MRVGYSPNYELLILCKLTITYTVMALVQYLVILWNHGLLYQRDTDSVSIIVCFHALGI